jgi:hypothetical protein
MKRQLLVLALVFLGGLLLGLHLFHPAKVHAQNSRRVYVKWVNMTGGDFKRK